MSLVRLALRICLIEALKGKTYVGLNVLDSQISALDVQADGTMRTDQEKPFVAVYTDNGQSGSSDITLRGLNAAATSSVISIEVGITAAMTETNEYGESIIVAVGTPATDSSFERYLDLVTRQVFDALEDPSNSWVDLAQGFIFKIEGVERQRAANADHGVRLAAHQLRITADLMEDPTKGESLAEGSPFAGFLAAMAASPDTDNQALGVTIAEILSGANTETELVMRRLGMRRAEAEALGVSQFETGFHAVDMTIVQDGVSPVSID